MIPASEMWGVHFFCYTERWMFLCLNIKRHFKMGPRAAGWSGIWKIINSLTVCLTMSKTENNYPVPSSHDALMFRNSLIQFWHFYPMDLQSSIPIRPGLLSVPASALTQWTLFHCAWWVTSLLFLHLSIVPSLYALPISLSFSSIIKNHTGMQGRNRTRRKGLSQLFSSNLL